MWLSETETAIKNTADKWKIDDKLNFSPVAIRLTIPIKQIKNVKNYVAIDGGMFDNPRFALYQAKYTVVCAEKMNDNCTETYSIAGKCCESGDIIAEEVMLPKVKEGDVLAVLSTGAYNYSMSSNYNRNLIPPVVMVKDGKDNLAVKPQTYDDLIRNDI